MSQQLHRAWFGGLALVLAACGPSPEKTPVSASVRTDGPQPESIEWLYATTGSSGVVKAECKLVANVLEKEQNCSGDLCRHAVNLSQDWLKTCREFEPAQLPRVEQLAAGFENRAGVSGGECAFEGVQLIDKGCPEAADCALVAQTWATKCSEHASPLVVSMIEKQVERETETPITLDTTSCEETFAKLTKSTECGNEFDCEEKVTKLKQYQVRCVDPRRPLPLDNAVKQALLLQSANQKAPPLLVSEDKFAPEKGRLLLDDRSGFVIAVGEHDAPNVNLLLKTLRESEYTLEVRLARIFSDKPNRYELRVGAIDVSDPETFFRRFASLKVSGQQEAMRSYAGNTAIRRLNEVVKMIDRQQAALAGLIEAFGAAIDVQHDKEFRAEIGKADKHLAVVFGKLADAKRANLPGAHVTRERMRERVAYARRAWQQPFADVTPEGHLRLGAVNPAVLLDVEALLPISFQRYRDNMDKTVGKALRKLENEYEEHLIAEARELASRCVAVKQAAKQHEQQLLACAFGIEQCTESELEAVGSKLDQAVSAQKAARAKLEMGLLALESPPTGKFEADTAACSQ